MKAFFAVGVALLALAGCASPPPSRHADQSVALTVSVDPVVEIDTAPVFDAHQLSQASVGVPPETLAGLSTYMQHNAISVGQIVHRVFVHQIGLHPGYRTRMVARDGAAQFRLKADWGLAQEAFGLAYHPQLEVHAELVTDGRVIWQNRAAITMQTESVGGRTWAELFASPQVLQAMYSSAARQVVARLLTTL
jgi:hypothetical protein